MSPEKDRLKIRFRTPAGSPPDPPSPTPPPVPEPPASEPPASGTPPVPEPPASGPQAEPMPAEPEPTAAAAPPEAGACVGIDLGTTYSAVAVVDRSNRAQVIPNAESEMLTPSAVFFDTDGVLVGREAVQAATVEPERAAECFKRDIGMPEYRRPVNGEKMRPESLSALVLKKLKQDAEDRIGPIRSAVITVPAFYDDTRRKATEDAGQLIGLNVLGILNEPSAAAIYYGATTDLWTMDRATFLVYDLGGGTFDATLMRVLGENEFETLATDGDLMLGGRDWDERLLDHVANAFQTETGEDPRQDPASLAELALRIEECKRVLSKRSSSTVAVSHAGKRQRITVTRETFEELTANLLARTQSTVELLIEDAHLGWKDVDRILLAGGSSHMPMVSEMLERVTGTAPTICADMDLAVAKGAALYAASINHEPVPAIVLDEQDAAAIAAQPEAESEGEGVAGIRIRHRDVNSHSLGVEVDDDSDNGANYILIPKNTQIPCEESADFRTSAQGASGGCRISIPVLEGEAKNPEACIRIGHCMITDLPPGLPEGTPVTVTFSYTDQGRIRVDAVVPGIEAKAHTEIVRDTGLTDEALKKEAQAVVRLRVL